MRYLSIVFASLLLVGCAQSTDVESVTQESDMQSQQEVTESPEVDQEVEESTQPETEEPAEPSEETQSQETESNEAESTETEQTEAEQTETEEVESAEPAEEVIEEEPAEEEVAEEPEEESSGFTMAMVSENDDASSCWSVINGNVYDLTEWINSHPGGPQRILSLCGADGSASFNSMHQGQSNPESRLQSFLLGPLS